MRNDSPNTRKQNEVYQACDSLHSRGENITNESIMQELLRLGYKRGSNSDITRYKICWKDNYNRNKPLKDTIPSRPDKLSTVIDEIRAEAWREARQELDTYKAEAEKQLNTLNETIRYSQQEIASVRQQYEVSKNQNSTLSDELQNLRQENINLSTLHKSECLDHQAEKQRHSDYRNNAESERVRLSDQYAQLVSLHKDTLENHKQQLGLLLEHYEQQRHQHIVKIDECKTQITRLEISIAQLTQERDTTRSEIKRLESELTIARTQYVELEKKLESIASNIDQQYRHWCEAHQSPPPYLTNYFSKMESELLNYAAISSASCQTVQDIQLKLVDHSASLQKLIALVDKPKS